MNKCTSTKKFKELKIHYLPGTDDLNGCLLNRIQEENGTASLQQQKKRQNFQSIFSIQQNYPSKPRGKVDTAITKPETIHGCQPVTEMMLKEALQVKGKAHLIETKCTAMQEEQWVRQICG